ncbi:N-acetyltransferase GCN5 [Enterobacter hormaechei]|uniref:GNAT family N-acetyltransferase n=1 Tax=Phytobacter ursingii TaxID=1972431 RepID=A0AB35RQ47_9ENTR|nr:MULTISPECIES: GNAT family N-acetyltransferase [Enterobacteriaceae]MDV2862675.1 GNAT family N-acetyltransferase [Phytobacter ursingii]GJL38275.1 N-acetyltransferase GCN5 [Enterobacter hormaechei]
MILTTARLTLSAFTEADWPFFLALRQSPDIMRFMGAIACEEDIRTLFITRLNESHARVIRDKNNEPLGDIGLNISTQHPQEADVGYAIAPFAQGKGFASEALKAIRDYAFTHTRVTALNAWVLAENQGSVRLLEKLGFTRTQVLEKGYTINDVDYDDWAYRLEKTR